MTSLSEDHNLRIRMIFVLFFNATLQRQHHRTGGIYNLDVVFSSQFVGFRGFSMCSQQHLHIVQLAQIIVVNGHQSAFMQTLHFNTIMHNVAQTVQRFSLGQFFLCFLYGRCHAETKATATVNFYLYHRKISSHGYQ